MPPPVVEDLSLEGLALAMLGLEEAVLTFTQELNRRLSTRDEMIEAALRKVEGRNAAVEHALNRFLAQGAEVTRALNECRAREGAKGDRGDPGPEGRMIVSLTDEALAHIIKEEVPGLVERILTPRFCERLVHRFLDENRDAILAYLQSDPNDVRDEEER